MSLNYRIIRCNKIVALFHLPNKQIREVARFMQICCSSIFIMKLLYYCPHDWQHASYHIWILLLWKRKKYILGKNNRNKGRQTQKLKTTEHHLSSVKRNDQPRSLHRGTHTSKRTKQKHFQGEKNEKNLSNRFPLQEMLKEVCYHEDEPNEDLQKA